jgi:hypothetical protein
MVCRRVPPMVSRLIVQMVVCRLVVQMMVCRRVPPMVSRLVVQMMVCRRDLPMTDSGLGRSRPEVGDDELTGALTV